MFHQSRGGVRGGKDQFSWENVKTDKDRECYLGHSLMAPVGKWQAGKDIIWYAKDDNTKIDNKKREFVMAKKHEEKVMMQALGYKIIDIEEEQEEEEVILPEVKKSDRRNKEENYQTNNVVSEDSTGNTKELDDMLMKLIKTYGMKDVYNALKSGDKHKKLKKKKA